MSPDTLTSNPSNAVRAGNAFVARFKREPVSSSDAAWLNGYVIALEGNAHETCEWRPIETAPKDEKPILLGCPAIGAMKDPGSTRVFEGRWNNAQQTWTSMNGFLLLTVATHWMPLPEPPSEKAEVCGRCRGSGRVPSPGGVEGEYCACGRCGGSGYAKSEGEDRG